MKFYYLAGILYAKNVQHKQLIFREKGLTRFTFSKNHTIRGIALQQQLEREVKGLSLLKKC